MNAPTAAFHLLAKPGGAACNLDCRYCFYLSKQSLYDGARPRMSDEVLDAYVRQRLEAAGAGELEIAWQGGEPTLMGIDFFERAASCIARHRRPGQRVLQSIQTNGLLIDEAWGAFLKEHGFLVGLSIDGPQPLHDAYRVDKRGRGTFDLVLRAWTLLRRHDVDVNVLCAVHAANADHPLDVYRFLRDELGAAFLQFIPIVERVTPQTLPIANQGWAVRPGAARPLYLQHGSCVTDRSVDPQAFGRFLCDVFDEWVSRDVGRVFVQAFDVALGSWLGRHNLCLFSPTCGASLALEHNGDLYSCDHFIEPDYLLGNILSTPLAELVTSARQRRFGENKLLALPRFCRECDVLFACWGECPRNRFVETPDGEPVLNYLCAGYRMFFRHVDAPMRAMAELLRQGRPASDVMRRPSGA